MKNKIIPIIMFIIIILLTILFILNINNKDEEEIYKYNGTYSEIIENYLNNDLYSTTSTTIRLDNGIYYYTKTIDYKDDTEYYYQESNSYKEEDNQIISSKYTFYIKDNSLCINKEHCNRYLSKEEETNYKNIKTNFNINSYLTNIKKISKTNNKQIYLIVDDPNYQTITNHLIYNYDIYINILNINNISRESKSNIVNEYQISSYPTILILDKNKVYVNNNNWTEENISILLEEQGFKSR